jgi:nitrite reductase/ring-hydroxylating ferredoxin subunit
MPALSPFGTRYPFHPYPTGWFAVEFSDELAPKQVKPIKYFGRDLVIWRTEEGKPVVADAHCPHLGAHLGYDARVEGDTIFCPFHAWGFGSSGKCVHVPYTKLIPPRAILNVWPVVEQSGIIWFWHDLDGRAPLFDMPVFDESHRLPNTGFQRLHDDFGGPHPQDVMENAVDFGHFPGVHSTGRASSNGPLEINGHRFMSRIKVLPQGHEAPDDTSDPLSFIDAEVIGGGFVRIESHGPMLPGLKTITFVSGTPVHETLTHYRVKTFFEKYDGCPFTDEQIAEIDCISVERTRAEQYSDGKIWPHKAYVARPMLSNVDGPFNAYRDWYAQYHPRVAEVTAEAAE